MRLVIADTGPINYLILIDHIDILPALFESVILPSAVRDELATPKAPLLVHNWIADPPPWVEVRPVVHFHDPTLDKLDAGEGAAITLAVEIHADLLLMDDREGVIVARRKGFRVAGTLTILAMAANNVFLISPKRSNASSALIFTTNKNSWTSFSKRSPIKRNEQDDTFKSGYPFRFPRSISSRTVWAACKCPQRPRRCATGASIVLAYRNSKNRRLNPCARDLRERASS